MAPEPALRSSDIRRALAHEQWWTLGAMRTAFGEAPAKCTPLGHDFGPVKSRPEYAFLAVDATPLAGGAVKDWKCSLVIVRPSTGPETGLAVTCDIINGAGPRISCFRAGAGGVLSPIQTVDISTVVLAGIQTGDWAVLFHADNRSASSSVFFFSNGKRKLKHLVTGLAPGAWDIWLNGWLEEGAGTVGRESGALYFENAAGNYYLRRRE